MSNAKELIAEYGIRPNKALGQNFLVDEAAIGQIVSLAAEPGLPMLEIGPGLGALTLPLAETGLRLAAVELDRNLAEKLENLLSADAPGVRIICADFLKTDLSELRSLLGGGELTVVGNLPYYITSQIVMRLVTSGLPIRRMVLMTQSEAAERFLAGPRDKNYVPLTVLSRFMFDISPVLDLSPASYYPMPEVSSTVLLFESRGVEMPKELPRFVKAAFASRRKTLVNNLNAIGSGRAETEAALAELGQKTNVRAEELTVGELADLWERLTDGVRH